MNNNWNIKNCGEELCVSPILVIIEQVNSWKPILVDIVHNDLCDLCNKTNAKDGAAYCAKCNNC